MNLYRITDSQYASDLNDTGGLYAPGRWHRRGTLILYMAPSVALAKLEVLANSVRLPEEKSLVTIAIPDNASMATINLTMLPIGWQNWPYLDELADIAEQWIQEGRFWIMRVPSAQSPTEHNYLLNPLHPEHATLQLIGVDPHPFDSSRKLQNPYI